MVDAKVVPSKKDRYIGAMAKALAVEVAGFATVGGATQDSMYKSGYYVLRFSNRNQLDEFERLVNIYLPPNSVQIQEVVVP